ncbi:MAG: calcium/sodium antiporter [Bacteroidales bacterium]|nr:calcium/sodium antiporter [Bacteroidales bacterium]
MFHDVLFLLMGLVLIIAGGNYVTNGSVAVARKFHVTPLVIGLTVVAFGSSTPDFVVSFISTIHDKSELAVGDIIGADIFDLFLVVGVTALISPIPITKSTLWVDLPVLALSTLVLWFCGDDHLFDVHSPNIITRTDGMVMLLFFILFMVYTFQTARQPGLTPDRAVTQQAKTTAKASAKPTPMWLAAAFIVGGFAALIFGGQWIVDGASGIARRIGMSEATIGLTIVAIGSSLPDLATSGMAAIKHQPGIALGNVVGACIFDILFVLGTCATVHPLDTAGISSFNFFTLIGASLLVWAASAFGGKRVINRIEGAVLTALYIAYIVLVLVLK